MTSSNKQILVYMALMYHKLITLLRKQSLFWHGSVNKNERWNSIQICVKTFLYTEEIIFWTFSQFEHDYYINFQYFFHRRIKVRKRIAWWCLYKAQVLPSEYSVFFRFYNQCSSTRVGPILLRLKCSLLTNRCILNYFVLSEGAMTSKQKWQKVQETTGRLIMWTFYVLSNLHHKNAICKNIPQINKIYL